MFSKYYREFCDLFRFQFSLKWFIVFVVFLMIEVLIALYVNDSFIRPYLGDVFVVILLFSFFRSFSQISILPLTITVLLISYMIEILQYFQIVALLNLQDNDVMRIVLGSVFSWGDIICYTIGAIICYCTQYFSILIKE